jgi:hypothetical protein
LSKWKVKLIKWLKRYGPAEIIGTVGAYGGSFLTYHFVNSEVIAAYGATMGENLGFYGTILIRELRKDCHAAKQNHVEYNLKDLFRTITNLLIDFGPAEALDSLIIRPGAIGTGIHIFGKNFGVIIGKIFADIIFYIPAIISYELRERFARNSGR